MATARHEVTTTPTQITGLTNGQRYIGRNQGNRAIFLAAVVGNTAPTLADNPPAFRVDPGGNCTLLPIAAESIWVWTYWEASSELIIDRTV